MKTIKTIILPFAVLLLTPLTGLSQAPGGMSESQMQEMMQGMAQMAACMQDIDQDRLDALAEEGKAVEQELKQLCSAGERDEAQAKAMEYGKKFMNSPEMNQLRQCGEMARQMLSTIPDYSVYTDPESEEFENRHVCDDI